jgi:histidine ammonia-lyase
VIELGAKGLSRAEYAQIVREYVPVEIDAPALDGVAAVRSRLFEHLETGAAAYGITTGLGHLAGVAVSPDEQDELQRSLLTARAAGLGPPLPAEVVRGTIVIRLSGFLRGVAGVTPELCRYLARLLNLGWSPVVPDGPYGAAGEIGPLAHLFQTLIGEGSIATADGGTSAAAALSAAGLEPYWPRPKEALALVNGSPFATALGIRLSDRARSLFESATTSAALAIAMTGAGARAASPRIGRLSGDPFALQVQERLAALLAEEDVWGDRAQPPVSARVAPQVHGSALRALTSLDTVLGERLRGTTDSPVYLETDGREEAGLYPSGAFHALDVVLALEAMAAASCHVVNLVEKRLHRLLQPEFSGLPEQLTEQPGLQAGAVALHKTVAGLAAEARTLAAPASIHAIDTSSGQEDVQSFTFLAAARTNAILDVLETALACELVGLRQASHLRGKRPVGVSLTRVVDLLAVEIEPIDRDRTLSADIARARRALVKTGAING